MHKVYASENFTGVNPLNHATVLMDEPCFAPDTVPVMEEGDTISYYVDGLDSIYVLYQDTLTFVSDSTAVNPDSTSLRLVNYITDIVINPGNEYY
jgi:hypothetical protein